MDKKVVMRSEPAAAGGDPAAPEQRDRVVLLRKSELIGGLIAEGRLDEGEDRVAVWDYEVRCDRRVSIGICHARMISEQRGVGL